MSRTNRLTKYKNWYRHSPSCVKRIGNRHFRKKEKQFFEKFGEVLRKDKERGREYW